MQPGHIDVRPSPTPAWSQHSAGGAKVAPEACGPSQGRYSPAPGEGKQGYEAHALDMPNVLMTNEQFTALLEHLTNPKVQLVQLPLTGLGNPGPLGLGGFALTTFVLSVFNTGAFLDKRLEAVVLPLALFYGGLAQFAAGMWEFRINNTFGATAFTSYGGFWMSFAFYVWFFLPGLEADIANQATGLYLLAWTVFTFYMTIAAFRVSVSVFVVFILLSPTFLLLTIGALASLPNVSHAGGWFGILCALAAWYGSMAVVTNSTFGRTVFPVGPYKATARGVAHTRESHSGAAQQDAPAQDQQPAASKAVEV